MKTVVHEFVKSCITCEQAKPDRSRYPGLLQPLSVPEGVWKVITMDFVEGLPLSSYANYILVVVDKFTKFIHLLPLKHPFTSASVPKLFLDSVYRLHGIHVSIVYDHDRVFTSKFWQTLFSLADVQLMMSSSYHPSLMARLRVSINTWKLSFFFLRQHGNFPPLFCECISKEVVELHIPGQVLV
jgi:hypothetical protein